MKQILLLLCLAALSCKKSNNEPSDPQSRFTFECYYGNVKQPIGVMMIWDAAGRDFVFNASGVRNGELYDNNSRSNVRYLKAYSYPSQFMTDNINEGRYFVYISTPMDDFPMGMYSYKYFLVSKGESVSLKKVFSIQANFGYDPW